jgi:amino acid transporter
MAGCIVASVFGAMNGVIFTKSRVAYALGRDGLGFAAVGRAHPTRATPHVSIMIQGAIAVALILALRDPVHPLRLFDRLTAYFVLVEWLALVFAIAAVFVLRRTMAEVPRPYRMPGYPWVPLFFIGGTAWGLGAILWSALSQGDYSPLFGIGLVGAGFPVYFLWRARGGEVCDGPRRLPWCELDPPPTAIQNEKSHQSRRRRRPHLSLFARHCPEWIRLRLRTGPARSDDGQLHAVDHPGGDEAVLRKHQGNPRGSRVVDGQGREGECLSARHQ